MQMMMQHLPQALTRPDREEDPAPRKVVLKERQHGMAPTTGGGYNLPGPPPPGFTGVWNEATTWPSSRTSKTSVASRSSHATKPGSKTCLFRLGTTALWDTGRGGCLNGLAGFEAYSANFNSVSPGCSHSRRSSGCPASRRSSTRDSPRKNS